MAKAPSDVGKLIFKNNMPRPVTVYVDGVRQGVVPSGKTCWIPKDGFVHNANGHAPESEWWYQGGWSSNGEITISWKVGDQWNGSTRCEETEAEYYAVFIADSEEENAPPTEREMENAMKMPWN